MCAERKVTVGSKLQTENIIGINLQNVIFNNNEYMNRSNTKSVFTANLMLIAVMFAFAINGCMENSEKKDSNNKSEKNELNGHEYVDLGLPSGLLWATCNVGAVNPEDYGDYFKWGETTPTDGSRKYKYAIDDETLYDKTFTKYYYEDGLKTLEPTDDAATANWGNDWRMPTKKELIELTNECTWEHAEFNGIGGSLITGPNGNTIFMPKAGIYNSNGSLSKPGSGGNYWSSSLYDEQKAASLSFCGYNRDARFSEEYRKESLTIRPVASLQK